jgi:hypothetical protein
MTWRIIICTWILIHLMTLSLDAIGYRCVALPGYGFILLYVCCIRTSVLSGINRTVGSHLTATHI